MEMDEMFLEDCKGNEEFLTLLDLRVNNDFSSDFQMFLPKNKGEAWRTQLMDSAFEILLASCPHSLVDPTFLAIIREFYIFVAESKVWAKGNASPSNFTAELKSMVQLTDLCLETIRSMGPSLPPVITLLFSLLN